MHGAFGYVVVIVCAVGVVVGLLALFGSGKTWEEYASQGMVMDRARAAAGLGGAPVPSAAAQAEQVEEIRQMLEARNHRRLRRGEEPIDVEAELARLSAVPRGEAAPSAGPGVDHELLEELRAIVDARNYRRVRRGEAPLDVDAEIANELQRLRGLS